MYKSFTTVDYNFLKSVKKYLFPAKKRKTLIYSLVMALLLALSLIYNGVYLWGGFIVIIFIYLFAELINANNKALKVNMRFITDSGTDSFSYTTSFEEDGIKIRNHASQTEFVVEYYNLEILVETEASYVIFTRNGNFIPVNKEYIGNDLRKEFLNFVLSKAPVIKFKLIKR